MTGLGKSLSDKGDFDEAVSVLRFALKINEKSVLPAGLHHVRFLLGRALLLAGEREEARQILEGCVKGGRADSQNFESAAARFLLAGMMEESGDEEGAFREYERCRAELKDAGLGNHPFLADTLTRVGELALSLQKVERARGAAREAVAMYGVIYGADVPQSMVARLVEMNSAETVEVMGRLAERIFDLSAGPGWHASRVESGWALVEYRLGVGDKGGAVEVLLELEKVVTDPVERESIRRWLAEER